MDLFSISQLEQFSGIKAHTIRMWEQRYDALHPNRSEGNTRYYDHYQLRRLLNIVSLMNADHKVSELCMMSDEKLFKLLKERLQETSSSDETTEYFVSQLIAAGMTFDEPHFEKIFSNVLLRFGMKEAYVKVIYPMLVRIGLMWSNDSVPPPQEHFISNILRQKLFSAIDALPPAKSSGDSWLLFLPENEFHEIGLLFAHYLIRQAGKKATYLGCDLPFETLSTAIKEIKPSRMLFFLVHYDIPGDAQGYLNRLSKHFRKTFIYFSGNEKLISQLKIGKEMHWIRSVEELEGELSTGSNV